MAKKKTSDKILKKREERRNHIITSAINIILKKGYKIISMDLIAKESGYSKGGINYYFKSKEDLLASVIDVFASFLIISLDDSVSKEVHPIERTRQQLIWALKIIINYKSYGRAVFDSWSDANFNKKLQKVMRKCIDDAVNYIAWNIKTAVNNGQIKKEIDPLIFAEIFMSELAGFTARHIWDEDATEEKLRKKIEAIANTLIMLLK